MIRLAHFRSLILALALSVTITTSALAEGPLAVPLEPAAGSTAWGSVSLELHGDAVTLVIELAGLEPGAEYVARLHAGSCELTSASFGHLGSLAADAEGRAVLSTTSARIGALGNSIDLTLSLVADGDHLVHIQ